MANVSWKIFVLGLIVVMLALVSFSGLKFSEDHLSSDDARTTITVVDDVGREVIVDYPAKRVVSLASSISETICAIGCKEALVAVDQHSIFPPALEEVVNVGYHSTANVELIVAQQPDVVFAWHYCMIVDKLEENNIPVYLIDPKSVDDILREIEMVGYLLGEEDGAAELKGFIEEYIEVVSGRVNALNESQKPPVYFEFADAGKTGSNETFVHGLVSLAGGINIAAESVVRYPILSVENIILENPEVIVKMNYAICPSLEEEKIVKEEICNRSGWADLDAVKNDQVYPIHYSEASINPRVVIGLLKFAKWFHPELFTDINIESVQDCLLTKFYSLEASS